MQAFDLLNPKYRIVTEILAEQALVAVNRELITRFEKKIQTTLARVWGEESVETTRTAASNPSTGAPFESEMSQKPSQIKSLESAV